jgi:hypothetical protein
MVEGCGSGGGVRSGRTPGGHTCADESAEGADNRETFSVRGLQERTTRRISHLRT